MQNLPIERFPLQVRLTRASPLRYNATWESLSPCVLVQKSELEPNLMKMQDS